MGLLSNLINNSHFSKTSQFSKHLLLILLTIIIANANNSSSSSSSLSSNISDIQNYFLAKYGNNSQLKNKSNILVNSMTNLVQEYKKLKNCSQESAELSRNSAQITQNNEKNENNRCKESTFLINNYEIGEINTSFSILCPHILYLIDNPSCSSPQLLPQSYLQQDIDEHSKLGEKKKPSPGEVWGYGVLFVTLISLSSLAGVSVMPFMGKKLYKYVLTSLIGLAVGSLTGSSVFHLIPQAYGLIHSDPTHHYLYTSLVVCGGIWLFFMVERLLKIIMEHKERKDDVWKRSKISSLYSSSTTPENSTVSSLAESGELDRKNSAKNCASTPTEIIYECQEQAIKASFGHQEKPKSGHEHSVKFEPGKDSVIATVAWMIIFGDGLHNFIDGLSIGTAFNESILTGISISVAVLCEELPHELGDFAVLLNAGMSIREALLYNFLSACTCYLGLAVGIFLGEVEASAYIFATAGGMFLYIALVDMVPEMNEVAEESSKISVLAGLKVLILQNIGMLVGITTLFILAMYQENIKF